MMKVRNPGPKRLLPVLLCAALLGLSACSDPSDTELIAKARGFIDKRDPAAATIELKNLLQKKPQHSEARLLLGRLLLDSGDLAGAEIELTRAFEAGHPREELAPQQARLLLAQRKPQEVLNTWNGVSLSSGESAAELKNLVAAAHLMQGDVTAAEDALAAALQRVPGHAPSLIMLARMKAALGQLPAAQQHIDDLLAVHPDNAEALAIKGDLLLQAGATDFAPVVDTYRKALALRPDLAPAHSALLNLLLFQNDQEGAARQLQAMQKVLPNHPETRFYEARLTLAKGDAKGARERTEGLVNVQQPHPKALLLAAQVELQLGEVSKAESLLVRAVQAAPMAPPPRRLLAQIYLRSGDADRALNALRPLLESDKPDAGTLALAGRAQMLLGDAKAAEASFAQASKLQPDDMRLQTSAALARMGQGQGSAVLEELEAIAGADTGSSADLALVNVHLRRGEYDAALRAVDALAAKQPQQATPEVLRGRIAMLRKDAPTARRHFLAALDKEPNFFQAVASLAALDMADGQTDAARARFQAVLKREPGHVQAHLALAGVAARRSAGKEEVARVLEAGIKANPGSPVLRAALIEHHMASGDTALALTAAQTAVAMVTDNVDLLDRLGRVQQASGDAHQAIASFTRAVALMPRSAQVHLRLAEAQLGVNNTDAAATSVRRALEAEPRSLPAQRAALALALNDKRWSQASGIARKVQSQRPDAAVGWLMEGEVELAQRRFDSAATALGKALDMPGGQIAAPRLHQALLGAKKDSEADRLAADWLKKHPEDMGFVLHLGDTAAGRNQMAQAEARYRQVLERAPDSVVALNNLAYVLVKQGKPGAVDFAEKAVKLVPGQPELMDTLALSYASNKQLDQALKLQAEVVAKAPDRPEFRLHLAQMHIQAGNRAAARVELRRLAGLGKAYAGQEEVARLLQSLES